MTLVNLTPHEINVRLEDGSVLTVPTSGTIARVMETVEKDGEIARDGPYIPVHTRMLGEVTGLPEPAADLCGVVSAMVAERVWATTDRQDIFSPGPLIRDDAGKPVGCNGLFGRPIATFHRKEESDA